MNAPTFLTIPVELRELIYGFLFSSYTIRHGLKKTGKSGDAQEPSNRIAILLSCHQVLAEANRHLPLNCTLHFRGTEDLLETLLSVDQSVVTRLRHIRVRAFPFPLYVSGGSQYYPTYYAAQALALLPGLCLDTLVVEDCWHGFGMGDGWRDVVTYFDIEALLRSNAWKHLTYITPCTDFIASGYDHRRKRSAQPETWDALLKERDGEEGGAEVQMYIVPDKQEGVTGNEKTEDGRIMQPWQAKPGHEVNENWRIAGPDQELKGEVRIVARRGKKATAVQLGLGEQRSWAEIKGKAAGGFAPEVLAFSLLARLSIAQQYPLPVTYNTTIKSPVDPRITISYKQPDANTCATAFDQKQYTGYVTLPPFTLESSQQNYNINTFFWFFEARETPETAPLTIWLNGGPGQSSMNGLFDEVGPCEIIQEEDGSYGTRPRVWGWDRSSNILFIDQPTQVGFSYDERVNASVDFSEYDPEGLANRKRPSPLPNGVPEWRFKNGTFSSGFISNTEPSTKIAAKASWHFLQGFLSVFPQYNPGTRPDSNVDEPCDVNLFAESYGGTYAPIFADFFEEQNDRRKNGSIPANTLDIRLGSVGIVNGLLDALVAAVTALEFAYDNTYDINGIDLTTFQNSISAVNENMGCRDLLEQCGKVAALQDPDGLGNDNSTNSVCSSASLMCNLAASSTAANGRSLYDYRVKSQVQPSNAFEEYLNDADVLYSIGAPINFTSTSSAVADSFNGRGDSARSTQLSSLAGLLARGIKVALIYGDADVICNWYGGQNYSLELASLVPGYRTAFSQAGYAEIVVNDSYIGGAVRQYGNLSFSRIYDSGHQVPFYQPETAFTVFSRIIQGDDLSTGRDVDLTTFSTKGPSTSDHKNTVPPEPESVCWLRKSETCTDKESTAIAKGEGTVVNGIWIPVGDETATRNGRQTSPTSPKSQPTPTSSVPLTGVFTATSIPSIKKTSAASSLGTDPPFCIPHLTGLHGRGLREVDKVKLFWIAFIPSVVVALFVFFASIRHRRHRASKILDDDAEDILESNTELDDLQPNAFLAPRPSIPMDTIAEASPRPSGDATEPIPQRARRMTTQSQPRCVPPFRASLPDGLSRQTTDVSQTLPTDAAQTLPIPPSDAGAVMSEGQSAASTASLPPPYPTTTSTQPRAEPAPNPPLSERDILPVQSTNNNAGAVPSQDSANVGQLPPPLVSAIEIAPVPPPLQPAPVFFRSAYRHSA
ncbi:Carboxypeptidase [Pyrenophora tritici-repentis]|nr:Carboxypeptidase [Pyrenophora tritici-repentis]KAF7452298.1 Carboxypeptidase [Pyrenophora tritici-repentis]PZD35756.1 Carboxypeptidase C (cathepsin A) [Pyrenophora tritici-repentis]